MPKLSASPARIVVDPSAASSGSTGISYEKEEYEEFWHWPPGVPTWEAPNLFELTGTGDIAARTGHFNIGLRPGAIYRAGVYAESWGPLSAEPQPWASIVVPAIWKDPGPELLITSESGETGGTFHTHNIHSDTKTILAFVAASQIEPTLDGDGLFVVEAAEGDIRGLSTDALNDHNIQIFGLLPGRHYFLVLFAMDDLGNWDQRLVEFVCAQRKLTVQFTTLHIYNDGDARTVGEAQFWFRVRTPGRSTSDFRILGEYYRPTSDIDDWSETDRPYSLGFAYLGQPEIAGDGEYSFGLESWATEDDGWKGNDGAWGFGYGIDYPVGFDETVDQESDTIDCPPSTNGSNFHYGVDVIWSVEYVSP